MRCLNLLVCLLVVQLLVTSMCTAQSDDEKVVYQSVAWSPGGDAIAFTAIKVKPDWSNYGSKTWHLFHYDLETRDVQLVDTASIFLSYSPDGKSIAYDKQDDDIVGIYNFELRSGRAQQIIELGAKARGPSWSPDGQKVAFYSDDDGNNEIYVATLESGAIQQITHRDEHSSYNPVWSPDSEQIVYYLEKGDSMDQVYLTDSSGSFHQNITADTNHNFFPSWTRGGRIIYTMGTGEVKIMDRDGSDKTTLLQKALGPVGVHPGGEHILTPDEDYNLVLLSPGSDDVDVIVRANELTWVDSEK